MYLKSQTGKVTGSTLLLGLSRNKSKPCKEGAAFRLRMKTTISQHPLKSELSSGQLPFKDYF